MDFGDFLLNNLKQFWELTGFANAEWGNLVILRHERLPLLGRRDAG